jgi:hypothetical protein
MTAPFLIRDASTSDGLIVRLSVDGHGNPGYLLISDSAVTAGEGWGWGPFSEEGTTVGELGSWAQSMTGGDISEMLDI